MVAKVNSGNNIQRILNYNENKVKAGAAECIHENMFGRDTTQLTFNNKLNGLNAYANRNMRATSKAVHISLNFHKDDMLENSSLISIADTYMERIGFGQQPYLVYKHMDAAHPHIHIVTTNIKKDGGRIIMYNIGRNQSEKARTEIEKEFGLTIAAGRKERISERPSIATYGKTETKKAIAGVLRFALRYKYTSLPELNAVLKQFNIVADRGKEGSFMHSKHGLLYSLLDDQGRKVGVPIKASSFYNKPTLSNLEKLFKQNEALRLQHKQRVKDCVDQALSGLNRAYDAKTFVRRLNAQRIYVLFRQNDQGLVYGVTFVDNQTKCVFNGSDLGKAYSANALNEKLSFNKTLSDVSTWLQQAFDPGTVDSEVGRLVDDIMQARQYGPEYTGVPSRRRKKKKRGRSI